MTSNKINSILIGSLVIVLIAFLSVVIRNKSLQRDLQITKRDLNKKDKQLGLKIDSLQAIRRALAEQDDKWVLIMSARKDSLRMAQQQANYWRNRYNHDKNVPIVPYTPIQLDSVISAIIR